MPPLTETADVAIPELGLRQRRFFIVGTVLGLLGIVGLAANPRQFFQSYLMAYMWCLGVTLGCLALGMVHQLSGGAWGVVIRREIGAASRVLPVLTLFFLPVVVGIPYLYTWSHADVVATDEVLRHKRLYLNVPFWIVRAVAYFVVWNAIVYFLNAWSLQQDRTGDPRIARRMQRLSAAGLVAYGLTITFASFDWLMSLEPHWYSTIYGVLVLGGQGLSALAFLIAALVWLSRRPPLDRIVVPGHLHDLGNLMLAFVMLWAYFSFSQYLIIWAGNLPAEISWYQHRVDSSWHVLAIGLVVFHFGVPFVLLLSRSVKRESELIVKLAIGMLIVRLFDLFWLIAPEFHDGFTVTWLDAVLPLSLGSLWLGCFISQLRGRAILPVHDPQFDEALGPIIRRGGERRSAAH
jgi:hypothetical protein